MLQLCGQLLNEEQKERRKNFGIIIGINMDIDKISCPICGKEFASSVIESHASKCLFLNESAKNETSFLKDSSPTSKKIKLKPSSIKKTSATGVKRKSLEYFSSQNSQRNEDVADSSNVMPQKNVIILVHNNKIRAIVTKYVYNHINNKL